MYGSVLEMLLELMSGVISLSVRDVVQYVAAHSHASRTCAQVMLELLGCSASIDTPEEQT